MSKRLSIISLSLVVILSAIYISGGIAEMSQQRSQLAAVSGAGSGLIAHYTFDDGSASDSAGSYQGTIVGATPSSGKIGNGAMSFDGNDYIYTPTLDGSGFSAFSFSLWYKTTSTNNQTFISWGNGTCSISANVANRVNCRVDGTSSGSATASVPGNDGNWHHVAYVHSASGQVLYIDGVQSGTASETLGIINSYVRLGRLQSGSTAYFVGELDDVRMYNRALSASEVGELYTLGGSAPAPTPDPAPSPDPTPTPPPDPTPSESITLVTPRLFPGDPAKNWYGGPNATLGYDILNLAMARDTNTTDNVLPQWSSDGVNWSGSNTSYAPGLLVSVPATPYNIKQYYRVRARASVNGSYTYSDWSNVVTVVTLYPPDTFSAVAKSNTSVYLNWGYRGAKDQQGREYELLPGSGYKVERSTDPTFPPALTKTMTVSQPYTIIPNPNNAEKKLVAFTDNDTFSDATYYYRVRAFTSIGDGETSKVVSLAPNRIPAKVDTASAYTIATPNSVAITFRTSTTGQIGYRIDRSEDSVTWTPIKTYGLSIPANPHVDSGLTSGRTYFYRVVAFNDVGDSPYDLLRIDIPNTAPSGRTVWYVDNAQTGGTNTGESWANAWRDVSSINWSAVEPGDTIYISGGSSGKSYSSRMYVMTGGIEGNPVTIRVGGDSGHNGKVTLKSGITLRSPWVTITGAKNPLYSFSSVENLAPNINMSIEHAGDESCIYSSAPEGIRLLWLDVSICGNAVGPLTIGGNTSGVHFNGNSGISFRAAEVAYSHIHDIIGTGIQASGPADRYGFASIHHNLIEKVRNDFVIGSGGLDIYNNIARYSVTPQIGHPDGFQIWAPYTRVYNNILHDIRGSGAMIYIQLQSADSKGVQIFNNVLYKTQMTPGAVVVFTTIGNGVTLSDTIIANNLIYDLNTGHLTLNIQPNITPISVRNTHVKNNISYVPTNPNTSGNFVDFRNFDYSVSDIGYDYNILAGRGSLGIGYKGVSYASPEIFNAAFPQYNHNSSAVPSFVNGAAYDYRLSSTDAAARDKGDDLSEFCTALYGWSDTNCPLKKDILGNSRESAKWDIGPYEFYSGQPSTQAPISSDITPPFVIVTAPSNSSTVSGAVGITALASDATGVAGVQIKIDGINLGTEISVSPYSRTWTTTGVSNGAHVITAVARDTSGNIASSNPITVTVNNPVADALAPSTPQNLSGTAVSSSQVNLTWSAATDNVGVAGYKLYRNGTLIASPSGTSFQNTTVGPDTIYTYAVAAIDAAGNMSDQSNSIQITTPGSGSSATTTSPTPSKPPSISNPRARRGSVILTWDNPSFTLFSKVHILRNTERFVSTMNQSYVVHETTGTTWTDQNAVDGTTYYYTFFTSNSAGVFSDPIFIAFTPETPVAPSPVQGSGGGGGSGTVSQAPTTNIQGSGIDSAVAGIGTVAPSGEPLPTAGMNLTPSSNAVKLLSSPYSYGSTHGEIKKLQEFLNAKGYLVAPTGGAGSPGNETTYFGPATLRALNRFQSDRQILSRLLDKATVDVINQLASATSTPRSPVNRGTTTAAFTRSLTIGSRGEDVRALQKFLNESGYEIAASGDPGSLGYETTYFGPATRAALARFQRENNIEPPAGYFGPITRKKVAELQGI